MKLRNKKTGEIISFFEVFNYNSLAELTAEWEDYEEPKKYYYLDYGGRIKAMNDANDEEDIARKAIGNYFKTEEEAEKAVEKLKAWKRLKDARFEFGTIKYNLDEESSSTIAYDGIITIKGMAYEDFVDDLDICFGGEE